MGISNAKQASNAFAHSSLSGGVGFEDLGVSIAKSGMSCEYQNAGAMLADCQSIIPVTTVGSFAETKMFLLCRSG